MDSLISGAARALSAGDPLGALKRVALRDDPPALALRGIAQAQLGDFDRAKMLLKRAARGFGSTEAVAQARCIVAEAEIALVSRDLGWAEKVLDHAREVLEKNGDHVNAMHARQLEIRRLLLTGRLDAATGILAEINPKTLPPVLQINQALIAAGIAMRRLRARSARMFLQQADVLARAANIPSLIAEIENAFVSLDSPVARLIADGGERLVLLDAVEDLLTQEILVIDACRYVLRRGDVLVPLTTRPVLFMLARVLAENWPGDASRETLLAGAFGARHADESHRARLRVEIGRLRKAIKVFASITATDTGFKIKPKDVGRVVVLVPPVDDGNGELLALLADGQAWSSSALAIALDTSTRTVQRALEELVRKDKVQAIGRGRARRWTSPSLPGFTTTLLLPGRLPGD